MRLADRIAQAISASGPLDDDELAGRLHVVRQQVNRAARRMEKQGILRRYVGPTGKIVNELVGGDGSTPAPAPARVAPTATSPLALETPTADLLLVTCVKEKASTPKAAKDLYTSALFRKERAYAEDLGVPWFILSAEHGLVAPEEWLAPYERYLPDTPQSYREAWAGWVVERLALLVGDLGGKVIEIHASEDYIAPLRPRFATIGQS